MEIKKTKDSKRSGQILLKKWQRPDGKVFQQGELIDVDRIKEKELIRLGYLKDPSDKNLKINNKPKKQNNK